MHQLSCKLYIHSNTMKAEVNNAVNSINDWENLSTMCSLLSGGFKMKLGCMGWCLDIWIGSIDSV